MIGRWYKTRPGPIYVCTRRRPSRSFCSCKWKPEIDHYKPKLDSIQNDDDDNWTWMPLFSACVANPCFKVLWPPLSSTNYIASPFIQLVLAVGRINEYIVFAISLRFPWLLLSYNSFEIYVKLKVVIVGRLHRDNIKCVVLARRPIHVLLPVRHFGSAPKNFVANYYITCNDPEHVQNFPSHLFLSLTRASRFAPFIVKCAMMQQLGVRWGSWLPAERLLTSWTFFLANIAPDEAVHLKCGDITENSQSHSIPV